MINGIQLSMQQLYTSTRRHPHQKGLRHVCLYNYQTPRYSVTQLQLAVKNLESEDTSRDRGWGE
jgi:hypothetical protein